MGLFFDQGPAVQVIDDAPRSIKLYRESWEKLSQGKIWGWDGAIATHVLSYETPLRASRDAAVNAGIYGSGLFFITGPESAKNAAREMESLMARIWGVEDKSGVIDWKTAVTSDANKGWIQETLAGDKRPTDVAGFTKVRDINELVNAHQASIEKEYEKTKTPITIERYNELLAQEIESFQDKYGSQVGFSGYKGGTYYVLTEDPLSHRPRPLVNILFSLTKDKDVPFDREPETTTSVYERLRVKGGITPKAVLQWWQQKTGQEATGPELDAIIKTYFKSEGKGWAIINDKHQIQMRIDEDYGYKIDERDRAPGQFSVKPPNPESEETGAGKTSVKEQTLTQKLSKFLGEKGGVVTLLGAAMVAAGFLLPGGLVVGALGGGLALGGLFGKDLLKSTEKAAAVVKADDKSGKAGAQKEVALDAKSSKAVPWNDDVAVRLAKEDKLSAAMKEVSPDLMGELTSQFFFVPGGNVKNTSRFAGVAA